MPWHDDVPVQKLRGRGVGLGVAASMLAAGTAVVRANKRSDERHRELVAALTTERPTLAAPAHVLESTSTAEAQHDRRRAFWRDMMTQVVGSLIAATVVAIVFILTGGYTEKVKYYVSFTLALLVLFTIIGSFAVQLAMPVHSKPLTKRNLTCRILLAVAIVVIGGFEARGVIKEIGQAVGGWANYTP